MNKTKSGAWAVGDPMSIARINSECEYAIENNINALFQTEEGEYMLGLFHKTTSITTEDLAEETASYYSLQDWAIGFCEGMRHICKVG